MSRLQAGRYTGVAVQSAGTDWLVFAGLVAVGADVLVAQGVARLAGGAYSFVANKVWSFESTSWRGVDRQVLRFGMLYAVSYALSLGLLSLFVEGLGAPVPASKLGADAACFVVNFLVMRSWVFRVAEGDGESSGRCSKVARSGGRPEQEGASLNRTEQARLLLVAMVFLGALLGFGIEPMVGRLMVAPFGSAVHVWLTTMMFFQGALFLGYLYAHLVAHRVGKWHLAVLLLPLLFLPPHVEAIPAADAPTMAVLMTLVRFFAVPFAVVSTTAVVAQTWLARSDLDSRVEPYPLYSASNLGSLAGLFGYPLLLEPLAGLQVQTWLWTAGYLGYIGLVAYTWTVVAPKPFEEAVATEEVPPLNPVDVSAWIALAAIPSAFLLAVTNMIALEVGSLPLIWVLPLALYLGTFIWTYREGGEALRPLMHYWPEVSVIAGLAFLWAVGSWLVVFVHLILLALLATMAHAELYARRPHPLQLTTFYLAVSLGGWMGGAFVSLLAPTLFDSIFEYPLAVAAFAAAMAFYTGRRTLEDADARGAVVVGGRGLLVFGLGAVMLFGYNLWFNRVTLFEERTFYGTFKVVDDPQRPGIDVPTRSLHVGHTNHGGQVMLEEGRRNPTKYHRFGQCIHQASELVASPRHFAVLGLGVGAIAAYARPGDKMTAYEIEPIMEPIARDWFHYLEDFRGDEQVHIVGDGRLALEQTDDTYDLMFMDAFSGDGIPFHLVTVEALEAYMDRLDEDGVLVVNVTNRFFDLRKVLKANFEVMGLPAVYNDRTKQVDALASRPVCVVAARNKARLAELAGDAHWHDLGAFESDIDAWTDDYVHVFAALRDENSL